jgi:transglutaminase-like putative cysteine protease
MRLSVTHRTGFSYEPAADRVALRLRLYPQPHAGQTVASWKVSVNGEPVTPLVADAFGNPVGLWFGGPGTRRAEIVAAGEAEVTDTTGVVQGLAARPPEGVFLRETPLTRPSPGFAALISGLPAGEPLARLHALSQAVAAAIAYRPGATGAGTTAAEALALGAGVCQDHAHAFIAGARLAGIPARYVVGYLLTGNDAAAEEATHAWAEAAVPGLGWVGFDPSAGFCPTDRYLRLGTGLDAADAAPVQGSVTGVPRISYEARVELAAGASSQEQ